MTNTLIINELLLQYFITLDAISSIIDLNKDGVASNWEYFIAMDPNNMHGNDYVWDHFTWDHCT